MSTLFKSEIKKDTIKVKRVIDPHDCTEDVTRSGKCRKCGKKVETKSRE